MTCTEFILAKLQKAFSKEEIEQHTSYTECIKTLQSMPGYLNNAWGVSIRDPTQLVWFVGELICHCLILVGTVSTRETAEWDTLENRKKAAENARAYALFMTAFFDLENPVISSYDFALDPFPSKSVTSRHPVLEVLVVSLKISPMSIKLYRLSSQSPMIGRRTVRNGAALLL